MTRVAFHFHVPDGLDYTCRLLRKAHAAGQTAWVLGSADTVRQLDVLLWTFSAQDFIPHAVAGTQAGSALRRSAILLADQMPDAPDGWSVLVNLTPDVPAGVERFERVIELVPDDEAARQAARQRWRHYRQLGWEIEQHDVSHLKSRVQHPS